MRRDENNFLQCEMIILVLYTVYKYAHNKISAISNALILRKFIWKDLLKEDVKGDRLKIVHVVHSIAVVIMPFQRISYISHIK